MAQLFPPRPADETPWSELEVLTALSQLDDDWMVFHSVAWQGERYDKQNDGEADFVIAHPTKGMLIVEVKGGDIQIVDGRWYSVNRNGEHPIKNPFGQAVDSKYALREYLKGKLPKVNSVRMGHVVAFPSFEVTEALSSDAPREIVWDRYDLKNIDAAVNRTARHWDDTTRFDDQQFASLRKALAPTRSLRKIMRHRVEDTLEELIELTEQQTMALRLLRKQRRALITGGAGTGKTVLASEQCRYLAAKGQSVLFLCYNAPLGEKLAADLEDCEGVTVGNFHKVARKIVADADMLPEGDYDNEWWSEKLPQALPDAAEKLGVSYDAIVIDEGQDFHAGWWTALELLLADLDDGTLCVFADAHQDLYRTGWTPPFDADPFELDVNCRNTLPIAERVNAIFDREEPSLGVDGPAPVFVPADEAEISSMVGTILTKLLSDGEGFTRQQVVVLSTDRDTVDTLRGQTLGGHKLTKPEGKGVAVETVHRFKGLEADAVVLVCDELEKDRDKALAYVGMSRARVLLFVIGPAEAKPALKWA